WDDGPGAFVTGFDVQGVMCHELGHALGLDHSNVFGSTMTAVLSGGGVEARSLHPDDVAGLHSIYGARAPGKPHLDSATVCGNEVRLVGSFFAATQNEVWLTRLGFGNATPLVLSNLPSTLGGTELRFGLPIAAGSGEVAVVVPAGGVLGLAAGARLSNPVPFDPLIQECGEGTASFCTGEATPGCPGCPCGNVSPPGEGGGCANVTGRGARLRVTGSARVGAATLQFTLDHAPPMSFALLVSGQDTLPPAGSPPGCPSGAGLPAQTENGLRCLAGSTLRLGSRALNALGETADPWEGPFPGLLGASIGQERYFQAFYRESPQSVCGMARNTSQAVRVVVLP
ncbi:MAG: matrixin family metalloprotease, partial [Planctomycetota bacterium]